jgi:hypothetical protein
LKTKIAEIELQFWFNRHLVPVVIMFRVYSVTFARLDLFYWKTIMRLWLLFIGFSVGSALAQGDFDPTPFFAQDIHEYPLVFLEFEVDGVPHGKWIKTYSDTAICYSPKPINRNDEITQFIRTDERYQHVVVQSAGLDTLDPAVYPYVFSYRPVEIYSYDSITGTDQRDYATHFVHKFASCFYLENRLTGRYYKPFINPASYRGSGAYSENESLPMYIPTDQLFFRTLRDYINRLSTHGAEAVLARDKEKFFPETNHRRESRITKITIGSAAFLFIATHLAIRQIL